MKHLLLAFALLLAPPQATQTVDVPIQNPSFTLQKDDVNVQDTGVEASALQGVSRDGVYFMKFTVTNYERVYPNYYEAKVLLGDHELCSADGWATQVATPVTLVCPSPGYIVFDQWPDDSEFDPHARLIVSFAVIGPAYWPLIFDNVSLTFTPEG